MPRFKVHVTSDAPIETSNALMNAGIPTIGPSLAKFTQGQGEWQIGMDMTAVLEAPDAQAAQQRVRQHVEPVGEIAGEAEPFESDTT